MAMQYGSVWEVYLENQERYGIAIPYGTIGGGGGGIAPVPLRVKLWLCELGYAAKERTWRNLVNSSLSTFKRMWPRSRRGGGCSVNAQKGGPI